MTEVPTRYMIPLDRKHMAIREGGQWTLAEKDPDRVYRGVETWVGNRRSLHPRLEQRGIVPSRQAEELLAQLSEQPSFREDEPLKVVA